MASRSNTWGCSLRPNLRPYTARPPACCFQASGTPLIATRFGALPEIIVEGRTGFVVDSVDEGVTAVDKLSSISPAACRRNIETRFSVIQMGRGYQAVYESVHADRGPRAR